MVSSKGKEVAGKISSAKRKLEDTGRLRQKRKNRCVLKFIDDAASEADDDDEESSDDCDFIDNFMEDEFETQVKVKNEPGEAHQHSFMHKVEEITEEELEKLVEERYKPSSGFFTYAEDAYYSEGSIEGNAVMHSSKDPTIWKVKCMVGRERYSAFCLMQKYVDLQSLGTKLQINSAFALDRVKGFFYIEAERECHVTQACKGLCFIYSSQISPVPEKEVSRLFSVQSKHIEVSVGAWARVKNGKYKGDVAQVISVNDARKKATVKLIPRINLQVMAEKFGGGIASKKTALPAPRLISSTELEEFRPFIQYRRDRASGQVFEVLDGLMLRDGYLYKKISINSLSFCGPMPSEDELLKFEPSKKEESDCQEWLTELFGEQKKKHIIISNEGGGKGEGLSSSSLANGFEVHDLVFFNQKDFGVIIGTEKDDSFKILKEGSEGPLVVTVELHQLKNGSFDKKFIALDHRKKKISINDIVKVLEGPLQGRQGIVKKIYGGIIYLYDKNELENSGYICCKSHICEKIKLSADACKGKVGESGPLGFDKFLSSPKSPLSAKNPRQVRVSRDDNNRVFSIGQSLRIRVGPLKGYLCRVLAVWHSDVTVKLDSQQKILTVKCDHLSDVSGKSFAISLGDNEESVKPFGLLGTQDCSRDLMVGVRKILAEGKKWGTGGISTERSSCPSFPSLGLSLQPESNSANPFNPVDHDTNKVIPNQNSSWGIVVADEKAVRNREKVGGWEKSEGWKKANNANAGFGSIAYEGWQKSAEPFDKGKNTTENLTSRSNAYSQTREWGNAGQSSWNKQDEESSWNKQGAGSSWSNQAGVSSLSKQDGGSLWTKQMDVYTRNESRELIIQNDNWCKPFDGWNKNGTGNKSDTDQQKSWDRTKIFDGGRGSGGRRGRGSSRGGRDQFGRGRSFCQGQPSGWSNKGEGNHGKDPLVSCRQGKDGGSDRSTWGKALERQTSRDGFGESKAALNSSMAIQTGRWGNVGNNSTHSEAEANDWKKCTSVDGGQAEGWANMKKDGSARGTGRFTWGKSVGSRDSTGKGTYGNDSWGKPPSGYQGFGGWNKNEMGNKYQQGRGSGGRRGRGGGRGGRDQFGRGRSFGRVRSSGWREVGQESHGMSDGTYWSGGQAGDWGRGKAFDGVEINNSSGRGGYEGRGGSDRGSFGSRGRSDRGVRGGWRGSNRGGFQCRGRSIKGGDFGGRGRGRRAQNGDWSSINGSGEGNPFGWNKGSMGAEGWNRAKMEVAKGPGDYSESNCII